jgi:hypothetical protein
MSGSRVEAAGAGIPAGHISVLRLICGRLGEASSVWAVTGSLAFALRGMDVTVHDIDLQSDCAGAYEIERRLAEFIVEPVRYLEATTIRSHFGALCVGGIRVEIMGDIEKRAPGVAWQPPVDLAQVRQWVTAHGLRIPVLSLEYEEQAYRALGRTRRADMLKGWLARE